VGCPGSAIPAGVLLAVLILPPLPLCSPLPFTFPGFLLDFIFQLDKRGLERLVIPLLAQANKGTLHLASLIFGKRSFLLGY
jgi:hypothetical protein